MSLYFNLSKIRKSYNGNSVLKDCSFSFDKSGIYSLMGENGSGKSTLLRICALLEPCDSGTIVYTSNDKAAVSLNIDLRRKITLVLPEVGIFNSNVYSNIAYGLKIRNIDRLDIHNKVNTALDLVNLSHKKNQNALSLSNGEKQRLGIARMLVIEPQVVFLDESTAYVDHKSKDIIEKVLFKLKKKNHSIIVMATHDKAFMNRISDHLLILKDGNLFAE